MNMLRFMRETHALKYLLWATILSFVAAVFFLWGGGMEAERGSGRGLFGEDFSVKAGDRTMPPASLRLNYQEYGERVRQALGDQYRDSFLKGAAASMADQMVDSLIVEQMAEEAGLTVSDRELADFLVRVYQFKDPQTEYPEMLARRAVSADEYERHMRSKLLVQKYRDLLADAQHLSDAELMKRYKEQNDKYKATLAFVRTADFQAKVAAPTEDELRAEFARTQADLKIPEKRSVRYLWVNAADVRAGLSVPDADVKAYYDLHKEQFGGRPFDEVKEQVRQTVLFTDPAVKALADAALAKAKAGLEKAKDEAALQALCAETGLKLQATPRPFSEEEPAGALGLDAALNKAVFAAETGPWSDPLPLRGGTVRFQVTAVEPSRPAAFEDVRAKLQGTLAEAKAEAAARATAQGLAAAKDAKGLEEAAKKASIQTSATGELSSRDYIPLAGVADAAAGKALAAASEGERIGPLKVGAGYLVAVVTEHKAADLEKFQQDKDSFAGQQAAEVVNRLLDEAVARRRKVLEDKQEVFINHQLVQRLDPSSATGE